MKEYQIGLNIYTLYYQFINNLEETFKITAQSGYNMVEMIGDYNKPSQELNALLNKYALTLSSYHNGTEFFSDSRLDATIKYNKEIGNDTLIIPSYKFDEGLTVKDWEAFAAFLQDTSNKLNKQGMKLGYHNHAIEFKDINGVCPWDIVMGNTSNDVKMQIDIGNARSSERVDDEDIIKVIKKYQSRAQIVHIKPWSKAKGFNCILGEDDINWRKMIDICKEYGNTQKFLVEMEGHDTTLERIKPCCDYLAGLVY